MGAFLYCILDCSCNRLKLWNLLDWSKKRTSCLIKTKEQNRTNEFCCFWKTYYTLSRIDSAKIGVTLFILPINCAVDGTAKTRPVASNIVHRPWRRLEPTGPAAACCRRRTTQLNADITTHSHTHTCQCFLPLISCSVQNTQKQEQEVASK